jgi:type II secretory pathway pseudopilin PulG
MNGITNGHSSRVNINASTGISIGIVIILASGIIAGVFAFSHSQNEIEKTNTAFSNQNEKNDLRFKALETDKNHWWSYLEMYKWAVKLQQTNKDAKKLQADGLSVPEPESITK